MNEKQEETTEEVVLDTEIEELEPRTAPGEADLMYEQ